MGLKEILNNFGLGCRFSMLQNEGWNVLGAWDSNNKQFFESGYGEKRGDLIDQAINKVADRKGGVKSVRVVMSDGYNYKTLVVRGSNS